MGLVNEMLMISWVVCPEMKIALQVHHDKVS